jgi:predicted phage terminase large subunit-like protein
MLALTDTYALCKRILGYTDLTPSFHGPLCRFLDTSPYAKNLYLCPRLHFKTSVITVGRNIRRLLHDGVKGDPAKPIRILIASNKEDNAAAMLGEIQAKLQTPELLWAFPDLLYDDPGKEAEKWTKTALTIKRRPRRECSVEAIGITGELTSKHYDHGTFDDLVGKENSETIDGLEGVKDWYRKSLALLEPHATLDLVGTTWATADLYSYLQEQKQKEGLRLGVYKIACWENPDGTVPSVPDARTVPTFPERFSLERLTELRTEMGAEVFAAQMLLNPEDASTAVFARAKILPYLKSRAQIESETGGLEQLWIAMTIDPAISTKAWADYTAIATGGFDRNGVLWLLDLRRGRWAEDRTLREIYDAYDAIPGVRVIGFEAVGFAQIYRRLLIQEGERRGYQLPITKLERDTRQKKNIRIRALQPHWEHGNLRVSTECPALDDFLEEASRFRTYKESEHDDLLDAVVDLFQLRLRPAPPAPLATSGDPELDARAAFELALLATRAERKAPPLDRGALRLAYDLHRLSTAADTPPETIGMRGDFWR